MQIFENFISYRRSDVLAEVQNIYQGLLSKGFSTFCDIYSLNSGRFDDGLKDTIEKCSNYILVLKEHDILSAFVSYASQDRHRVAMIIQGMKKARPDMDIFFDVESLRSGDDGETALWTEIDKRDILFLCWSHFAKESKWVDAEWRYALSNKGVDCIEPVPIESPDVCPPPDELTRKHFNDKLLYIINSVKEQ